MLKFKFSAFYAGLIVVLTLIPYACMQAQSSQKSYSIYFASDEYLLDEADKEVLNQLIAELPPNQHHEIDLKAHTDSDASDAYNEQLSQKRAISAIDYLEEKKFPSELIVSHWYGEKKPSASNAAEIGKQQNRRVEIVVNNYDVSDIQALFTKESNELNNTFTADPTKPIHLTTKKGMEFSFPANAFVNQNGEAIQVKNIEIEITEVMNTYDAFISGIGTMSDEGLLQSGGMYNLKVSANGEDLKLKPGDSYELNIPTSTDALQNMSVYVGNKNTQGEVIWTQTENSFNVKKEPQVKLPLVFDKAVLINYIKNGNQFNVHDAMTNTQEFEAKKFSFTTMREPGEPHHLKNVPEKDLRKGWGIFASAKKLRKQAQKRNEAIDRMNEGMDKRYQASMKRYEEELATRKERKQKYEQDLAAYRAYRSEKLEEFRKLYDDYINSLNTKAYQQAFSRLLVLTEGDSSCIPNVAFKMFTIAKTQGAWRNVDFEKYIEKNIMAIYADEYGTSLTPRMKHRVKMEEFQIYRNNGFQLNSSFVPESSKPSFATLINADPYLTEIQKEQMLYNLETSSIISSGAFSANTFLRANIPDIGYVNCDRLYNYEPSLIAHIQLDGLNKQAQSYAIIKNINAMQAVYDNKFQAKKGESIRIISIQNNDGTLTTAIEEIVAGDKKVKLDYKPVRIDELKKLIAENA